MKLSRAQIKKFKALEQSGDGFFDDVISVVKSVAKVGKKVIKFAVSGVRKISSFLKDAGVPESDQVAFLAWMAGQKKYELASKALGAASIALRQAGRGDGDKKKDDACKDEISIDLSSEQGHRPRSSGSKPSRKVSLAANDVIQLADPVANQPYDTNKELPQLAQPNASLNSTPLFGHREQGGKGSRSLAIKGAPRSWGSSASGNLIAATSDANPRF